MSEGNVEKDSDPAQADQYFMTIGKLAQNAAITDIALYCAFRVLSGCPNEVAKAIYHSMDSVHAKAKLVSRVVKAAGDDQERVHASEIIEAVKHCHAPRNELSHAFLDAVGDPGAPWQRRDLRAQHQPLRPVTVAYLKSLLEHSGEGVRGANRALVRLCERRGVSPDISLD